MSLGGDLISQDFFRGWEKMLLLFWTNSEPPKSLKSVTSSNLSKVTCKQIFSRIKLVANSFSENLMYQKTTCQINAFSYISSLILLLHRTSLGFIKNILKLKLIYVQNSIQLALDNPTVTGPGGCRITKNVGLPKVSFISLNLTAYVKKNQFLIHITYYLTVMGIK